MSLRSVLARHGRAYQVVRQMPGTYDASGHFVPPAMGMPKNFTASIQPLSGRQLASLPEGQSAEDTRVVYTTFELRTRGPANAPDIVLYNDEQWRVYQVLPWEGLSGSPHYVAYIARQTNQASPV